jgi:phage-related baseplate assembly protein
MATNLPEPSFVDRDPAVVERDAVALFEALTQRQTYPAQPERIMLDVLAYRETQVRIAIQEAAKQNLVYYATGNNLDHLGVLVDVQRLSAAPALTTFRFTKAIGFEGASILVDAGTQISALDGRAIFETLADLIIPVGQVSASVAGACITPGTIGNDYAIGAIADLIAPISGITSASNTSASSSGAEVESDDRFRERIKLAPNKFSVAGARDAYKFWALTAASSIIDVAIVHRTLMFVDVYVLTSTGLASNEVRNAVFDTLNDDRIRPLTDIVTVLTPEIITYQVSANITLDPDVDPTTMFDLLSDVMQSYVVDRAAGLGRSVVRSQIIAALQIQGVYSVDLVFPAIDLSVAANQWANGNFTIAIAGFTPPTPPAPTPFSSKIFGGLSSGTPIAFVQLTSLDTADFFEFAAISNPIGTAASMRLRVGGTERSLVTFPADYLGQPFRFTLALNGQEYPGVFTDGDINF